MAHLYADENFPYPATKELRNCGHDVLTVLEAGKAEQAVPDEEVLAFATSLKRIVLTINRKDFILLHRNKMPHAGIIVCTFDVNFAALARRIDTSLQENTDFTNKLIRINRPPQ